MPKGVIVCNDCLAEAFYDGVCPNDVAMQTGYEQQHDGGIWLCPDCKPHGSWLKDYIVSFAITLGDFEQVFKRWPADKEEFERFCSLCEKVLKSSHHIDWDIIFSCVKDEIEGGD